MRIERSLLALIAGLALLVSACGGATPTPTAVPPTPTTAPAAATAEPTQEPTVPPAPTPEATAEVVTPPTPEATAEPTAEPTAEGTPEAAATVAVALEPTPVATAEPTAEATVAVALEPTPVATAEPTAEATVAAALEPTSVATAEPTAEATVAAALEPTPVATAEPTAEATVAVALEPTPVPTEEPAATPEATAEVTAEATAEPTAEVTAEATAEPTAEPTAVVMAPTPTPLPACRTTGELIVGTDAAYPPFENVNTETGEIEGFDIDLLNAIAARAGFTPVYQNVPFDTIFTNLAAAQYDIVISATTITEERQQTVLFSNPYFAAAQVLTVRAADAETLNGVEALAGRKVGVQKGTTGADFAKGLGGFDVVEYETTPEAMRALANGDVDAVIADDAPSKTILLNNPELNLAITVEALTVEYYGIAVRLECTDLIEAINAGLAEVIKDGTYAELYRKYFGVDPIKELQEGGEGLPSQN